jgi:ABC-type metal ion transport system substrate-binding protein
MRGVSLVLIALVAFTAFEACGSDAAEGSQEATGIVLAVDARSLTDVRSFTLKTQDETLEIRIDPHADYSFPPSHLRNHALSGQPVRVELDERGGDLYATEMEDA